jgi:hypothetical protein
MWQHLVWEKFIAQTAADKSSSSAGFPIPSEWISRPYIVETFPAKKKALADVDREDIEIVEVVCEENLGNHPNSKQKNFEVSKLLGTSNFIHRQSS